MGCYKLRETTSDGLSVLIPPNYARLEVCHVWARIDLLIQVTGIYSWQRHGSLGGSIHGTRCACMCRVTVGSLWEIPAVVCATWVNCLRARFGYGHGSSVGITCEYWQATLVPLHNLVESIKGYTRDPARSVDYITVGQSEAMISFTATSGVGRR